MISAREVALSPEDALDEALRAGLILQELLGRLDYLQQLVLALPTVVALIRDLAAGGGEPLPASVISAAKI